MSERRVHIGNSEQFVQLIYEGPLSSSWLGEFRVRVSTGLFTGEAECWDNRGGTNGIYGFRSQIEKMNQKLEGQAVFRPMEEQISFRLSMTRTGRVDLNGRLFEHAHYGTNLNFEIGLDQSYLPSIIADLKALGV